MPTGVLRASFNERGFTFIEGGIESDARDIFLHIRSLAVGEDSKLYVRGAQVEFDLVLATVGGEEKPQAQATELGVRSCIAASFLARPDPAWTVATTRLKRKSHSVFLEDDYVTAEARRSIFAVKPTRLARPAAIVSS